MNIFHSLLFHLRFFFWTLFLSVGNFLKNIFHKKEKESNREKDLALFEYEPGILKCVACKLCEVSCPAQAIIIDAGVDGAGRPYPSRFDIDMTKCVTCGLCEQACPVDAIGLVSRAVLSVNEKDKLYYQKDILIHNGRAHKERHFS